MPGDRHRSRHWCRRTGKTSAMLIFRKTCSCANDLTTRPLHTMSPPAASGSISVGLFLLCSSRLVAGTVYVHRLKLDSRVSLDWWAIMGASLCHFCSTAVYHNTPVAALRTQLGASLPHASASEVGLYSGVAMVNGLRAAFLGAWCLHMLRGKQQRNK